MALLGGCIGSLLRALLAEGTSPRELWGHFVAGVLMGLVVACLYLLGLNTTPVPLPTQDNPITVFDDGLLPISGWENYWVRPPEKESQAVLAELNKAAAYVRSLLPARLSGDVETD